MSGPVGIFDSGFGGLSVVKKFFEHLPAESVLYFGDNGRAPYGSRTQQEIEGFVLQIGNFLVEQGAKALVIACNTATAAALPSLQAAVSVPVIGIIEPGSQLAVATSRSGRIGVIATEFTISSRCYHDTIQQLKRDSCVFGQACPSFTPFVEQGRIDDEEVEAAAREYLSFVASNGIDTLVLGCTHFPHLQGVIRRIIGPETAIVDPAEAVVAVSRQILCQLGSLAPQGGQPQHRYYTSGDPEQFRRIGQQLLGYPMAGVEHVPMTGNS
ncbi:MAG: glutamate racemase [Bacillota bacterium]|jgi:glutamate racemase